MMNKQLKFDSGKLVYYLDARDLNQTKFAEKIGVSRTSVNKWCSGEQEPEAENVVKIAEALNVQVEDLMKDGELVYIKEIVEELTASLSEIQPYILKQNLPYLKELARSTDKQNIEILKFMMEDSNAIGKAFLCRVKRVIEEKWQTAKTYEFQIPVYCMKDEQNEYEYDCIVQFEAYVAKVFGIEENCRVNKGDSESKCWMLAIHSEKEPDTEEWRRDIEDSLNCTMCQEMNHLDEELMAAFIEMLDNAKWNIQLLETEEIESLKEKPSGSMEERMGKLVEILFKEQKIDLIAKAAVDEEYRNNLFEAYDI